MRKASSRERKSYHSTPLLLLSVVCVFLITACTSMPNLLPQERLSPPAPSPQPDPEVVRLSVLVTPTAKEVIPPNSRIVVANISGRDGDPCSEAVKDALMRRLIENSSYDVLSRDDLDWIVGEMERNWSGIFNTKKVQEVGKLLGASLFVVGRVSYCGYTSNTAPDSESPVQFSIFATLQIIDLETGRVVVSSASEGNFVPRASRLATLLDLPVDEPEVAEADPLSPNQPQETTQAQAGFWRGLRREILYGNGQGRVLQGLPDATSMQGYSGVSAAEDINEGKDGLDRGEQYQVFRAAEDLANGFADNFFARPVWQTVEMWHDPTWSHSDSIHFVKLGDCPRARQLFEQVASQEVSTMDQTQLARYLHNYGVVLMCANDPDRAVDKLRSAYRLGYNKTTLRMLGLARKAQEWALRTEEDEQPEVDALVNNSRLWSGK